MIYDCFHFFNEIDMAEIRFNILNDVVDKFVVVEANKTHTGIEKPFIFEKEFSRFEKFKDKIIYIKVTDFPNLDEADTDNFGNKWLYENFHRDSIMRGLKDCKDDDIIIISDCDEIIKPEIIKKYKKGIVIPQLLTFYYYLNMFSLNCPYSSGAKICRYSDLLNPKQTLKPKEFYQYSKSGLPTYLRFCKGKRIKNAGWHFGYIGGVEKIIEKKLAMPEQQYNTSDNYQKQHIEECIKNGKDIFGRESFTYANAIIDKNFPEYIVKNQEKYSKYINSNNCQNLQFLLFKSYLKKFIKAFYSVDKQIINGISKTQIKILGIKFVNN